jgi:hypothetical protein
MKPADELGTRIGVPRSSRRLIGSDAMRIEASLALGLILITALPANGLEVIDLHQTDNTLVNQYQHDPYRGIFNWAGVHCCNGEDCRKIVDPKDIEPIQGGYRVRSTGEIVDKKYTGISPDNGWHICRRSDLNRTIRCLLVPPSGV